MSALALSRNFMNPDKDFVLHGRTASYWEKAGHHRNSQLTNTTARLSQHALYDPDNYRVHGTERKYARNLSELANNLEYVSNRVGDTLKYGCPKEVRIQPEETLTKPLDTTEVSMHESLRTDIADDELLKLYEKTVESLDKENTDTLENIGGKPLSPRDSQWFVNPNHLPSAEAPTLQSVGQTFRRSDRVAQNYSDRDKFALKHFPITLGSAYELCAEGFPEYKAMLTKAPPSVRMQWSRSRSASPTRKSHIARVRDHFDEEQDLEKLYLTTVEAPNIGSSSFVLTSPYQLSLGKLRLERLQLEESKLLQLKRLAELERIRGPKPQWYSSKGLDFHYEAHKNTEMIKCEEQYQDLLDYREDLLRSSYLNLKKHNKTFSK